MRTEGTLAKWNDERGFGFIRPTKGEDAEVFVHVSAFPRDAQRPSVGELLTFEIETDKRGKKKATNLLFPNRVIRLTPRPRKPTDRHGKPTIFGRIGLFAIVAALAFYGYEKYAHRPIANEFVAAPQKAAGFHFNDDPATSAFKCGGRIHCSQMTSCSEATFFLKNCPNVQMDGNRDGVPCEQQWCGK